MNFDQSIENQLKNAETIYSDDEEISSDEELEISSDEEQEINFAQEISSDDEASLEEALKQPKKLTVKPSVRKQALKQIVAPIPINQEEIAKLKASIDFTKSYNIASFDVGIKNLAYCIMSFHPELPKGAQFMIHDWQVIDILSEDTKKMPCHACHLAGNYYQIIDGVKKFYCLRHGKSVDIGLKENRGPQTLIKHRRVDNTTNLEINVEMITALDRYPLLMRCHEVVIEQQPSKNAKMKNLSFMLFSYFATRGLVDTPDPILRNIRFISGKHKLNVYDGPPVDCHLKGQYHRNKFYGQAYCRYMIRHDPPRLDQMNASKKKDDLADCFLQGAWYLIQNTKLGRAQISKS